MKSRVHRSSVARLCVLLMAAWVLLTVSTVSAQVRVLLVPQDRTDAFAAELAADTEFDFEVTEMPQGLETITLEELLQYDVAVVWTNNSLADGVRAGNVLADYVDQGGGVVEMVFSQYSTSFDIEGRWRDQNYSNISTTSLGIATGGSLGQINDPNHPIMQGVETITVNSFRTGDNVTLLPGANLIASYDDGQILAAERNDKAGRVMWVGMYPTQPQQLSGDWRKVVFGAIDYAAVGFRATAGGVYEIEEGTETVTLNATGSRGDIVAFEWDLDSDGEYDDAQGPLVDIDTTGFDGPSQNTYSVRVTNADNEIAIAEAIISVTNVAPLIVSEPPLNASIGNEYTYTFEITDPGAEFDPIEFELVEGPQNVTFDGLTMLWTPGPEDFETTLTFLVRAHDGDDGSAEQTWELFITAPDEDGDNIPDEADNCPSVINPDQFDNDNDGEGDACDPDDDNDTIPDGMDNCRFDANAGQTDTDSDGLGNECDADDDNDFVPDEEDNCPTVTNPSQRDTDGDGIGDACQNDRDLDGIPDGNDNCPDNPNITQDDNDSDGEGDVCDDDDDNDGLDDAREGDLGTNPFDPDTDNDDLEDGEEADIHNTDPMTADTDGDGLDDGDEVERGTDPLEEDSDSDGLDDGQEVSIGTDPLVTDTDGDRLSDGEEVAREGTDPTVTDTDRGGVDDGDEVDNGTNPLDASDDVDTDGFNNDPFNPEPDPDPETTEENTVPTDEACGCATVHRPASAGGFPGAMTLLLLAFVFVLRRR